MLIKVWSRISSLHFQQCQNIF